MNLQGLCYRACLFNDIEISNLVVKNTAEKKYVEIIDYEKNNGWRFIKITSIDEVFIYMGLKEKLNEMNE